jgi:hypothetical protein
MQTSNEHSLRQILYKNETIKEQNFVGELYILTFSDGKWSLYNYTQNKKIGTSKDRVTMKDKIPETDYILEVGD